ncbi:MAG: ThiF family adenylyltransferase [Candidatus Spechtbacterales bacterium]
MTEGRSRFHFQLSLLLEERRQMMADYSRQVDIIPPDMLVFPLTIIGVGHIGSNAAHELASIGCPDLIFYDDERVEEANIPAGFFKDSDAGKLGKDGTFKVEAVREAIRLFSPDCKIQTFNEEFSGQRLLEGVVVSGVDSMDARRAIWRCIRSNAVFIPLYIDGRTGGEIIQIYTVRPSCQEDIEWYEMSLEHEGAPLPCGAKSIGYAARIAAGLIASQFKKWLKQEEYFTTLTFNVGENIWVREGKIN